MTMTETGAMPHEEKIDIKEDEKMAKVPCRNKLVNSGRQGAPPARTEEQGNLNDSERRGTQSAGMDRRSERSSYSCTGPKGKVSIDGRLAVFHCNGGRLVRPDSPHEKEAIFAYLPCTGRVDLATILSCLRKGARGVLLVGCPEGLCRFPSPQEDCLAETMTHRAKRVCEIAGWDPRRVKYARAACLEDVVSVTRQALQDLRNLGDQPLSAGESSPNREKNQGFNEKESSGRGDA